MASPKRHWCFAGGTTTQCGLLAEYVETVESCVDSTCKTCIRTNPGSPSKERAWHKKSPGGPKGQTLCGIGHVWWREGDLNLTSKDREVTCGLCLRCMRAAARRKRREAA